MRKGLAVQKSTTFARAWKNFWQRVRIAAIRKLLHERTGNRIAVRNDDMTARRLWQLTRCPRFRLHFHPRCVKKLDKSKRQKNEQEAGRPPQLMRQIRHSPQDEQPSQRDKQPRSQPARPFHVARVGVMTFVRIGLDMTVWLEKHRTKHGCQR